MSHKVQRVLGIDPGYGRMGWAVVERRGAQITLISSGHISTPAQDSMPSRIDQLYQKILSIISTYKPALISMEKLFFQRNTTTAIAVGQARGIVLLAAAQHCLPVREFTPSDVKLSTTGYGRADKRQISKMVQAILKIKRPLTNDDESDAIAIALCAINHRYIDAA